MRNQASRLFLSLIIIAGIFLSAQFSACSGSQAEGGEEPEKTETTIKPADKTVDVTKTDAPTIKKPEEIVSDLPATTMSFDRESHDFGDITPGETVTTVFKFTNTGSEPLVISNARGSCGCTVPDWPREPIQPGEESQIEVSFDSKNKFGAQTKTVTITANTDPNISRLTIKGTLPPKETADNVTEIPATN